jgi:hypothetical protein
MISAAQESTGRRIRLTANEYGQADIQTFLVPWELWEQLRQMSGGAKIVGTTLAAGEALSMSCWITEQQSACASASVQPPETWSKELRLKTVTWGAHLYLWGDDDGKIVEQLAAFLKGGAVTVLAESRSHE